MEGDVISLNFRIDSFLNCPEISRICKKTKDSSIDETIFPG